ncbi:hypothetical protein CRUP_020536 [Coryphaenoides rupestris]|nr:hypothetical protein CRUP_020536 [Coryphaenoides rupestris]
MKGWREGGREEEEEEKEEEEEEGMDGRRKAAGRLSRGEGPLDSTNSSENIYTMMGPGGNRPNFPMGPGPDGPMGAMGAMEPHHMNGSLGSGDMDGLPKNSPNNMGGMNNPPGTPRDDGEMGGNFLNPFQSESPTSRGEPMDMRSGVVTPPLIGRRVRGAQAGVSLALPGWGGFRTRW